MHNRRWYDLLLLFFMLFRNRNQEKEKSNKKKLFETLFVLRSQKTFFGHHISLLEFIIMKIHVFLWIKLTI